MPSDTPSEHCCRPTESHLGQHKQRWHSRIDLTMNVYTDPTLLDIHAAVDALPELTLSAELPSPDRIPVLATGTDGSEPPAHLQLAPTLAPTAVQGSQQQSTLDNDTSPGRKAETDGEIVVTPVQQRENACFGGVSEEAFGSERYWTRTSDLLPVKQAL